MMKISPERKEYPVTAETIRELLKERDALLMQIAELKNENERLRKKEPEVSGPFWSHRD